MSEEYAEKMSRKKLPELLLYVRNRAEYREDAVLAALEELARRGQEPAEAATIRAELQPIVEQQRQEEEQAAAARTVPTTDTLPGQTPAEGEGPELYSPGTIALFSMLFSFLAGGILMILNLFRLKESGKALRLILFVIVFLMASSYGLQWLMTSYGQQMRFFSVAVNLIAVLAYLLYFWPRYVGPRSYVSRQWLPALLVCMALMIGLYMVAAPFMASMQK